MTDTSQLIDGIYIAPEVFEVRPDFAVLILSIDPITNGPSDDESRSWLSSAAQAAQVANGHQERVGSWTETYKALGIKPKKYRSSVDALIRRVDDGLPEINRVVDAYNSISVKYGIPIGGEDLDAYVGPPRLVRANGDETFDTVASGEPTIETVDAGEVIWRDDNGATCRRWNWRQGIRTRVEADSSHVFFIIERLEPLALDELQQAGQELVEMISTTDSTIKTRLITA